MGLINIPKLMVPQSADPWQKKFSSDITKALKDLSSAVARVAYWQTGETLASATTITITSPIHTISGVTDISVILSDTGVQGETRNFVVLIPIDDTVKLYPETAGAAESNIVYKDSGKKTMLKNVAYLLIRRIPMAGTDRTNPFAPSSDPMWYVVE